jgi:hypothetical protein
LDILLTGESENHNKISKIYKNSGNNTFSEQINITLQGVHYSSVTWGDYDNDGDLDILLTGENENHVSDSKIYKNNGDNTFTSAKIAEPIMNAEIITSESDPLIAPYLNLKDKHLKQREGLFVVEGEFLVRRLLKSHFPTVSLLVSG